MARIKQSRYDTGLEFIDYTPDLPHWWSWPAQQMTFLDRDEYGLQTLHLIASAMYDCNYEQVDRYRSFEDCALWMMAQPYDRLIVWKLGGGCYYFVRVDDPWSCKGTQ